MCSKKRTRSATEYREKPITGSVPIPVGLIPILGSTRDLRLASRESVVCGLVPNGLRTVNRYGGVPWVCHGRKSRDCEYY